MVVSVAAPSIPAAAALPAATWPSLSAVATFALPAAALLPVTTAAALLPVTAATAAALLPVAAATAAALLPVVEEGATKWPVRAGNQSDSGRTRIRINPKQAKTLAKTVYVTLTPY